jgi:hypothetical protein
MLLRNIAGGLSGLRQQKTALLTTEESQPRSTFGHQTSPLTFCRATTDLHVGKASQSRDTAETRQQCCHLYKLQRTWKMHIPVLKGFYYYT